MGLLDKEKVDSLIRNELKVLPLQTCIPKIFWLTQDIRVTVAGCVYPYPCLILTVCLKVPISSPWKRVQGTFVNCPLKEEWHLVPPEDGAEVSLSSWDSGPAEIRRPYRFRNVSGSRVWCHCCPPGRSTVAQKW